MTFAVPHPQHDHVLMHLVHISCTSRHISPSMTFAVPHPQHDHVVMHLVYVVAAFAATLKAAAFAWCFFPAMTGAYPVVGVSLMNCDCMHHRQEVMSMHQGVADGRSKFMQRNQAGSMH